MKVQKNQMELKLNGTHQLLGYANEGKSKVVPMLNELTTTP
jgi:hypothetical protein